MEHERGIDGKCFCVRKTGGIRQVLDLFLLIGGETTYYEADEEWDVRGFRL